MTSGFFRACARVAVSLLLCVACSAQAPTQAVGPDTVLQLHGTVVNGVTGKPIARALVFSADQRLAALTDENGQFAIEVAVPPLPAALLNDSGARGGFARFSRMVNLMARKPGYATPMSPTNLALDETLSSKTVELKLMPTASISGNVSADDSDAPEGVQIKLLRHQIEDGRRLWTMAGIQVTDSRGEFHFQNLEPGEYTLLTGDWAGEQGEVQPAAGQTPRPFERYAPVFYGDADGFAEATKAHLQYGDALRAEMHLHKVRYFPVVVPVNVGGIRGGMNVSFQGPDFFKAYPMRYDSAAGTLAGALPDGSYTILLTSYLPSGERQFAQVSLHVGGAAVRTALVTLATAPKIEVRVHTEFKNSENQQVQGLDNVDVFSGPMPLNDRSGKAGNERRPSPPLQMFLRSADEGNSMGGNASATGADELVIENARPGRYYVQAVPMGMGYIASMTADGADLLQQPLVVRPDGGAGPIDVTLRDDMASVGVSFANSLPPDFQGNVFLYFLPRGGGAQAQMSVVAPARSVSMMSLAPGSYQVVAFRGAQQDFAFRDADEIQRFAGKGAAVIAAAGQTVQVEVPVLDDTQAAEVP